MTQSKTSEFVAEGHPDKMADIISDSILDYLRGFNPAVRAGIETLLSNEEVILRGEIGNLELTDEVRKGIDPIIRAVIQKIGYVEIPGFSFDTVKINEKLVSQSSDISMGVDRTNGEIGAGDQGMMIGFATNETSLGLPAQFHIAKELMALHNSLGDSRRTMGIRPDAKCQMTISDKNVLVFSTSHDEKTTEGELNHYLHTLIAVLLQAYPEYEKYLNNDTTYLINPTGRFVQCGPSADVGLTGRKIIVDSYGAASPVGGGAFSGKDFTKVDRSAAYMARYLALYILRNWGDANNSNHQVTVQLSYAIGVPTPVAFNVEANFEQGNLDNIAKEVYENYKDDLSVKGINEFLRLENVMASSLARNGHFGKPSFFPEEVKNFTWEVV